MEGGGECVRVRTNDWQTHENERLETLPSSVRKSNRHMRHVFDRIHGDIVLSSFLTHFLDLPQVQRLAHIKQLGGCSFVYPSATHTRLEHSIGVCHLSRLACEKLGIRGRMSDLVQLAGLLHDVGHGPFSHTTELALKTDHEQAAVRLCEEWATTKEGGVSPAEWKIVSGCINGNGLGGAYEIVHSRRTGVDVDKLDYLARDAHAVFGMTNAIHIDRVLASMRLDENGFVVFLDWVAGDIVDLFHLRARLHSRVYQHRSVLLVEKVLEGLLQCFREDVEEGDIPPVHWNDAHVLFSPTEDARALQARRLLLTHQWKKKAESITVCVEMVLRCPDCHHSVESEDAFCSHCGRKAGTDGWVQCTHLPSSNEDVTVARVQMGTWCERLKRYDPLANVSFVNEEMEGVAVSSKAFFVPRVTSVSLVHFYSPLGTQQMVKWKQFLTRVPHKLVVDEEDFFLSL